MSEIKLKPCPFCGGNADLFHIPENTIEEVWEHPKWLWNNPGMWVVGCDTDNCIGCLHHFSMIFPTEEMAVKSWNRRAKDD